MKKIVLGLMCAFMAVVAMACTNKSSKENVNTTENKPGKFLVVYYSQTGNTRGMAKLIQSKTGADIYEIKVNHTYDLDMWKADAEAKKELSTGNLPHVVSKLPDLSSYTTILIGGPVWNKTVSNPMLVFMRQINLKGKKVSSFWTFYDSDYKYDADMKKYSKGAEYINGIALPRSLQADITKLNDAIDSWLETLK